MLENKLNHVGCTRRHNTTKSNVLLFENWVGYPERVLVNGLLSGFVGETPCHLVCDTGAGFWAVRVLLFIRTVHCSS